MIVSIFGLSCVGKSSAAHIMATDLRLPQRSCGSAVRSAAQALDLDIEGLPDHIHRVVDAETIAWALKASPCIVEGRFLDSVFFGISEPVFSIRLTASADVRLGRACGRAGHAITMEDLESIDRGDREFRRRLYDAKSFVPPSLSVDTSESTVQECVNQLKIAISDLIRPRT
jgi:cytidylate kinase